MKINNSLLGKGKADKSLLKSENNRATAWKCHYLPTVKQLVNLCFYKSRSKIVFYHGSLNPCAIKGLILPHILNKKKKHFFSLDCIFDLVKSF